MEKRKEKGGRVGGRKEGARRKERKWKKKKKRRMNEKHNSILSNILFFKKNLKRKDSGVHAHEMVQDLNDTTKLLTTKYEEN